MMNLSKILPSSSLFVVILSLCISCQGENSTTTQDDSYWGSDSYAELCRLRVGCRCSTISTVVDCSDLRLTDLPSDIRFPRQITSVEFQLNHIKAISESTFFHSPGVELLDFTNNSLSYIAPSSFISFENLINLRLSYNQLEELSVMLLDGLNNLRTLDLSHNAIKTFQPSMFKPTSMLKELKLHSNPLQNLISDSFKHLSVLETLKLKNTQLKALPEGIFLSNPLLNSLSLAENPFYDIPTDALSHASNLKFLDLSSTLILEIKPHAFHGLTNLTVLFLDYQREMITIEKGAFAGLLNLTTLHCSFNPVLGYIHSTAFEDNWSRVNSKIRQVHLRDNDLKTLSAHLLPWKTLEYVDLRGNPWLCDCHLKWMVEDNPRNDFVEDIRCVQPKELETREIARLSSEDFVCTSMVDYGEFMTLIVLLTAFFLISVAISLVLMCRHSACLMVRAKLQNRYVKVLPSKDKFDLEWDYSADP